jgi:excisionase family DNA binding protein
VTENQSPKYIGETEKNLARLQEEGLDQWVTTTEAARLTGYNAEHVRRLIRGGKIEAIKWGRDWLVHKESFLLYIRDEGRGPKKKETDC